MLKYFSILVEEAKKIETTTQEMEINELQGATEDQSRQEEQPLTIVVQDLLERVNVQVECEKGIEMPIHEAETNGS